MIAKVVPEEIGARIRTGRRASQLTQTQLSELINVSIGTISRLERGIYEPSISTLCLLSEALGVTLDFLIKGPKRATAPPTDSPAVVHKLCSRVLKLSPTDQRLLMAVAQAMRHH